MDNAGPDDITRSKTGEFTNVNKRSRYSGNIGESTGEMLLGGDTNKNAGEPGQGAGITKDKPKQIKRKSFN